MIVNRFVYIHLTNLHHIVPSHRGGGGTFLHSFERMWHWSNSFHLTSLFSLFISFLVSMLIEVENISHSLEEKVTEKRKINSTLFRSCSWLLAACYSTIKSKKNETLCALIQNSQRKATWWGHEGSLAFDVFLELLHMILQVQYILVSDTWIKRHTIYVFLHAIPLKGYFHISTRSFNICEKFLIIPPGNLFPIEGLFLMENKTGTRNDCEVRNI